MALTVLPVDPARVEVALNIAIDLPAVAYVGIDNGRVVGTGGLAWGGGRCWLWFSVEPNHRTYPVQVIRYGKKLLQLAAGLGETEVYTPRDADYPTSGKLLKMMGFAPTGETVAGHEVYRWQL